MFIFYSNKIDFPLKAEVVGTYLHYYTYCMKLKHLNYLAFFLITYEYLIDATFIASGNVFSDVLYIPNKIKKYTKHINLCLQT